MKNASTEWTEGWLIYLNLVYFSFFFLEPIRHHVSLRQWLLTVLGAVVFLALYLGAIRLKRKTWQLACLAVMVLVGATYLPGNGGANVCFIFAAGLIPHVLETEFGVMKAMAVLLAVIGLETWALNLSGWFLGFTSLGAVFSAIVSFHLHQKARMYLKLKLANAEIEHLAKVAERERIARDLHDVLGHTLSVIILKSELAARLIDRDPERAKVEMRDVEETSRAALAEVRSTIRGYRVHSLETELAQAKASLETAGVAVTTTRAELALSPAQDGVVALVVREAVTNVLRHAHARTCCLRLAPVNGNCRLEVQDDGCGGLQIEGHGIRGMRERIEALGGTLQRDTSAGTKLTIEFPLILTTGAGKS
jgi:two-component system sensor histidine kinase DesK